MVYDYDLLIGNFSLINNHRDIPAPTLVKHIKLFAFQSISVTKSYASEYDGNQ
jgi:hypothetical protein